MTEFAWEAIGESVASPYIYNHAYRRIFDRFYNNVPMGGRVLDVGCGPGVLVTEILARRFQVVGIDYSERMIGVARQKIPHAAFVRQSFVDTICEGEFDGVAASYSLLCLEPEDFVIAARNITNVLKPGGYIFLALNEAKSPQEGGVSEVAGQRVYARAYTEAEIRDAFAGLSVLAVKRGTVCSEMWGNERLIALLLKKTHN